MPPKCHDNLHCFFTLQQRRTTKRLLSVIWTLEIFLSLNLHSNSFTGNFTAGLQNLHSMSLWLHVPIKTSCVQFTKTKSYQSLTTPFWNCEWIWPPQFYENNLFHENNLHNSAATLGIATQVLTVASTVVCGSIRHDMIASSFCAKFRPSVRAKLISIQAPTVTPTRAVCNVVAWPELATKKLSAAPEPVRCGESVKDDWT